MSHSDDTEELLEATIDAKAAGTSDAERADQLAGQLRILREKLRTLEAVSCSESVISARDYFLSPFTTPGKSHTLPKRSRRPRRPPRTPNLRKDLFFNMEKQGSPFRRKKQVFRHLRPSSGNFSLISDIEKLSSTSSDDYSNPDDCNSLISPDKKKERSFLTEIDTFLNFVEKCDNGIATNGFEEKLNDFTPPSRDDVKSTFASSVDKIVNKLDTETSIGKMMLEQRELNVVQKYLPLSLQNNLEFNKENLDIPTLNPYLQTLTVNKLPNVPKSTSDGTDTNMASHSNADKSKNSLPSLSELWDQSAKPNQCNCADKAPKYEEEKMRRQHCEDLIQKLQKKTLEQEQKIAVAVRVDSAKNELIERLRESLKNAEKIQNHNEVMYKEALEKIVVQYKEVTDYNNKLKQNLKDVVNEMELVKAQTSTEISELKKQLSEREDQIKQLRKSNDSAVNLNKQMTENFIAAQKNFEKIKEENRRIIHDSEGFNEIKSTLEGEIKALKVDRDRLTAKVSEEQGHNLNLDKERANLQYALSAACKKFEKLQNEHEQYKKSIESQKNDIKNSYQKQLNEIIMNKAGELQNELDTAKLKMIEEVKDKEKDIALEFARHLTRIEESHKQEIRSLENKQRDQINCYEAQLSKSNAAYKQLENKLLAYKQRRAEIASQLHNVIESQMQHALKLISSDVSTMRSPNENSDLILGQQETSKFESQALVQNQMINVRPNPIPEPEFQVSNEQLQHYINILLNRVPGFPDALTSENLLRTESKSKFNARDSSKRLSDVEYPTQDKSNEGERKGDKNRGKRPWK